jgi:hypothetical protein
MGAGLAVAKALVPDGESDLLCEGFEQRGRLLPEIVAKVDAVHPGANEVPGIEDASCFFNDAYGGLPRGNRLRADVIEAIPGPAAQHQLLHDAGYVLPPVIGSKDLRFALIHSFQILHVHPLTAVEYRLLKNAHLRRCPYPSSLRRTGLYDSVLGVSGALYLHVFEQTASRAFSSILPVALSLIPKIVSALIESANKEIPHAK